MGGIDYEINPPIVTSHNVSSFREVDRGRDPTEERKKNLYLGATSGGGVEADVNLVEQTVLYNRTITS